MGEITELIIKRWKSKFSFKIKLSILIFFIALTFSPGLLLTLPPNNYVSGETDTNYVDYLDDIFMSNQTNIIASFMTISITLVPSGITLVPVILVVSYTY